LRSARPRSAILAESAADEPNADDASVGQRGPVDPAADPAAAEERAAESLAAEAAPAQEAIGDLEGLAARLEAAIFAVGGAGLMARLRKVLKLSPGQIDAIVEQINRSLSAQGRPYEIAAVAGGYQFRTRPEWSDFIAELQPERKTRWR
jgi:hypothetical protein